MQLKVKTILFQEIQFGMSAQFSSIWPIDKPLSGATTVDQSEPDSDGNKGILRIPQSSRITVATASDCLVSFLGPSLGDTYPAAKMQSVYFTTPADWAVKHQRFDVKCLFKPSFWTVSKEISFY